MNSNSANESHSPETSYQVVARKYRPQSFQSLIGQGHIATALSNAINQSRVGHAYLFTGARGVGKTSSARIFAKCLNCVTGPTTTPCDECDSCNAISVGEDVDVLEIDGASNRGIDEIRSLRSNAAIRPSRSRFKIYIIDEVHMLTMQAFNALLKTLEEPPRHVKFIFCTTDPHKIPITVLSRCQRFDFSPVQTAEIAHSLKVIAEKEGKQADDAALELLARRANGSMRDSQSLLEQIFSFCGEQITVDDVHQLLGTADIGRVLEVANAMLNHDPASTLELIHQACSTGVDPGLFASQLLGFFRDLMAVKVNCSSDTLLTCSISDLKDLKSMADRLGLETILSIVQILDTALVRMQSSLHARTLIEVAAIRICELENLESISDLIKQLGDGTGSASPKSPPLARRDLPAKPVSSRDSESSEASKKKEVTETKNSATRTPDHQRSDPGQLKNTSSNSTSSSFASTAAPASESVGSSDLNDELEDESSVSEGSELTCDSMEELSSATTEIELVHPAHAEHNVLHPSQIGSGVSSEVVSMTAAFSASTSQPQSGNSAKSINTNPGVQSQTPVSTIDSPRKDSPRKPALPDSQNTLSDIDPARLRECWNGVAEGLGGMTTDMINEPELLVVSETNRITATLKDEYTVKECFKSERKQKIEQRLSEALGFRVTVDFVVSKNRPQSMEPSAPRLSRSQQIRILMDQEIVKLAAQTFEAEITNFFQAPPKKISSTSESLS